MVKIFRDTEELKIVEPSSSSNYVETLMGDHQITLVFDLPAYIEFFIGDYIVEGGVNYRLNKLPTVKKISARLYQYNAVFQHPRYDMLKVMYLLFDTTARPAQGEFSLTGTAETFVDLLVSNLNRIDGGWMKGDVIESDFRTLTFSNENCHAVLERIADEFNTEYHVLNKTIHVKKKATMRELTLEYGSTAYDIERVSVNSADVITRLYAFGSDQNISSQYRGGSGRLLLPSTDNYIESDNSALYGVIEQAKTFDDIYPRLSLLGAGKVTSVGGPFEFSDTAIDFDVNDFKMPGIPAKVRFLTGDCAGYDFEIQSYEHAYNKFVIIENKQDEDLVLPTFLLKPKVNDRYVLLDILMPDNYIDAAEAELLQKAEEYLQSNDKPKVEYRVQFSEIFAKKELPVLQCGDQVHIYDEDLGIDEDIRITKIQRGIREGYKLQVDISNTVSRTIIQTITDEINTVNNQIVVSNESSKARWIEAYRRSKELREMVFDPDGYFNAGNIRPASIETSMISTGSRSQQFQTTCLLKPNYAGSPQLFYWSSGLLIHFTINNDNTVKMWTIGAGGFQITGDDQAKALYIYARCSRTSSTADIYLDSSPLRFDSNATHFLFLIGVLHSPLMDVRGISLSYGQTLINGQFITTGVIASIDGSTKFDLNNGKISGNIQFLSNGVLKTIDQVIGDIKIGARNLIRNSGGVISGTTDPAGRVIMTSYPFLSGALETGKEYTFSYRRIGGIHLSQLVLCNSSMSQLVSIPIGTDGIATFTCTQQNITRLMYYGTANSAYNLEKFKLEAGNKATDWTPAPEDINEMLAQLETDVSQAIFEAQNANNSIGNLNSYVDTAFRDGIINEAEAKAIEKYINEINASKERVFREYQDLYTNTYLTGTAKTNLLNAKINLFGHIDALLTAIQVAISDGSTTAGEKAEVDTKYAQYTGSLGDYTQAVMQASKAIQDMLKAIALDGIASLEVGGENYYNGNNLLSISSPGGSTPTISRNTINTPNGFEIVSSSGGYLTEARVSNVVRGNGYHVVSCYMRVAAGSAQVNIDICDNHASLVNVNTDWQFIQAVANVSNYTESIYNFVDFQTYNHVTIQVKDFMVQKGNKATDFKKSTELLLQALQGSTDVLGGLLATNVILMKNQENNITGGISGLTGDNIAQWSGGTYNDAIEDALREFGANMQTGSLDKKDGGGHRAFGKLAWDVLGNAFFGGTIEALSGKIGGLDIFSNTLKSASMSFSETPVETLSTLMSPTSASISQQSSWSKTIQNQTASAFTQPILLTTDSQLRFRATCVPGYDILHPNSRRWEVRIFGANNVIVFRDYGDGILNDQLYSVNLPAGEFVVQAIAYQAGVISSNVTNTATLTGESTNVIYAYSYTAQTKIGSDGFYSFWSSDRYIYFKSNYGFEGRYGNVGLRFITGQSNPQKMVGGSWSNL
jgi:hypothetical protein